MGEFGGAFSFSGGAMDPVFIDDGYNRDGHVAAQPGLHGALTFRYRPALPEERFQYALTKDRDGDGKAYVRRMALLLAKHLQEWDAARGPDQSPVPITAEALTRLHPNVLNGVLDQVLGYTAADARADEKNSPTG